MSASSPKSRRYVYLSRPLTEVYDQRTGELVHLDWLEITDDVRDGNIHRSKPGKYAIHPRDPHRVYVLAELTRPGS